MYFGARPQLSKKTAVLCNPDTPKKQYWGGVKCGFFLIAGCWNVRRHLETAPRAEHDFEDLTTRKRQLEQRICKQCSGHTATTFWLFQHTKPWHWDTLSRAVVWSPSIQDSESQWERNTHQNTENQSIHTWHLAPSGPAKCCQRKYCNIAIISLQTGKIRIDTIVSFGQKFCPSVYSDSGRKQHPKAVKTPSTRLEMTDCQADCVIIGNYKKDPAIWRSENKLTFIQPIADTERFMEHPWKSAILSCWLNQTLIRSPSVILRTPDCTKGTGT